MKEKIKRKLKHTFGNNAPNNLKSLPFITLILSLTLFIFTIIYTNTVLSTKGIQLQSLNTEKNLLLQENRLLENDLANAQSITVVQNLTIKKYKLIPTKTNQLVYITGNITASR